MRYVILINVCPDDHLVVGQMLGGKFFCNIQGQFRGDLPRFEGLDDQEVPACGSFQRTKHH